MGRAADPVPRAAGETGRRGVARAGKTGLARFAAIETGEVAADRTVHCIGLGAGAAGSAALLGIAAIAADRTVFQASLLYTACLMAMLGSSAAYHLAANSSRREFLRRLDHAAIFVMIAGTYTPFTICRLQGAWAIGMTAAVWAGAIGGAVLKLTSRRRFERASIVAYLALGWLIVAGIRPMLAAVGPHTAMLIGIGGLLYSIGAGCYLWRTLPFRNAIWHALVLVAAACHYAAILGGVVLAGP